MPGIADRSRRLTILAGVSAWLLAVVGGCLAPGASSSDAASSSGLASSSAVASLSSASGGARPSTVVSLPSGSPSPPDPVRAIAAADWLLAQSSARFSVRVDRSRPGKPDQALMSGSGVVDPAGDRGRMRYDPWVHNPGEPDFGPDIVDIVWGPLDYWIAPPKDGADQEWLHWTRDFARTEALIGRANEEPLALVRFLARADSGDLEALAPAEHEGVPVERWLVPVAADDLRAAFVPPDTYLGFAAIYKRPTLPLEAWLANGRIVRMGYVLERDKIPAGGSDRTETWYAWSGFGEEIDLVVPPAGTIRERPS